jgi:cell division protein FtsB
LRAHPCAPAKILFFNPQNSKLRVASRLMTLRRSVAAFYALLFVALTLFAGLFFLRTYGELRGLQAQRAENERRLVELDQRIAENKRTLERLRTDPAFVERVIRERLGYARPDEVVFRFDR